MIDGSKQTEVTNEDFETGIDRPVKAKLAPESEDDTKAGVKYADNSAANLESNVKDATIELSDKPDEVKKKSGLLPVSSSLPVLVLSVWLQASPDNQMLRRL